MGSHTHSGEVQRLDVVETGRRRRWSEDEKLRIVTESFNGPRLVSATARRHGISPSQLYTWRRAFRAERIGSEDVAPGFTPAMIIPETNAIPGPAPTERMEIVVAKGRRIIVDAGLTPQRLSG